MKGQISKSMKKFILQKNALRVKDLEFSFYSAFGWFDKKSNSRNYSRKSQLNEWSTVISGLDSLN